MKTVSTILLLGTVMVLVLLKQAVAAPARDRDPFLINSTWRGKLTQNGGGPNEFQCELKITRRDGENFEAELHEKTDGLELTYLVRGTIRRVDAKNRKKGFRVEFESFEARDVQNTAPILRVPYTGTLIGNAMKGSWKLPADSPFGPLEGGFQFEFGKKK